MINPVVVISGANGVLAGDAARTFAGQGASLALLSSNLDKLNAFAAGLNLPAERVLTAAVDLRSSQAVDAAAAQIEARFGRADILLHLVGGWTGGKNLALTSEDELENMLSQHVWTTYHLARAFTPGMVQRRWGRVIIVSSPNAVHPGAGMGPYSAAKAAQEALFLSLAQEVREAGVTANIIQVRSIDATGAGKGTPPAEITAAMLYLSSDAAAHVNGARLPLF